MTNITYTAENIKFVVNIKELLLHFNAKIVNTTKNEIQFKCLNPSHDDHNASSFYNTDKHQFNCLGCTWSGSIFSLVMLVKHVSYEEAVRYLKDYIGLTDNTSDENILSKMLEIKKKKKTDVATKQVGLPAGYDIDFNKCNDVVLEYIKNRNIPDDIIKKYYIGYCNVGRYKDRLILPIVHFDKIMSFSARATWSIDKNALKDERYLFETDSPVGEIIWGLFNNYSRKNAIFVEGIFDALRLRQYGLNAFSCLNNDVTSVQIKLITDNFDGPIYIMPDNDKGGQLMIKNFHSKLYNKIDIKVCSIHCKDPDELSYEAAHESFDTAIDILDLEQTVTSTVIIDKIVRRL